MAGIGAQRRGENPSTASLPLAVTHTTFPSAEVTTRTALHPAGTVPATASAGLVSAWRRSIAVTVPSAWLVLGWPAALAVTAPLADSLVA
jgi:hypothetical protein